MCCTLSLFQTGSQIDARGLVINIIFVRFGLNDLKGSLLLALSWLTAASLSHWIWLFFKARIVNP